MNSKKSIVGLSIIAVIIIPVFIFISTYNNFISTETEIKTKWAQIENQLQRRSDLIPNLVETVKGYAQHEKEIFTDIANARSKLSGVNNPKAVATANNELSGALNRLLVVSERYPDLKSNENFKQLSYELTGTENRIAVARKDYNDNVSTYNKKIRQFPGSIIARMSGFTEKEYFKVNEQAKQNIKVDFNGRNK